MARTHTDKFVEFYMSMKDYVDKEKKAELISVLQTVRNQLIFWQKFINDLSSGTVTLGFWFRPIPNSKFLTIALRLKRNNRLVTRLDFANDYEKCADSIDMYFLSNIAKFIP